MRYYCRYWLSALSSLSVSHGINLNPDKRYLVTGTLTLKNGSNYAHVYISERCTGGGDVILCGIYDENTSDIRRNLTEVITNGVSITITLKTNGGDHRAEGVIYEL